MPAGQDCRDADRKHAGRVRSSCGQIRTHGAERIFSRRETCAWEMPIISATSIWVLPEKKRREMISRSLSFNFLWHHLRRDVPPTSLLYFFIAYLIHYVKGVATVRENGLIKAHGSLDGIQRIGNVFRGDADSLEISSMVGSFRCCFVRASLA